MTDWPAEIGYTYIQHMKLHELDKKGIFNLTAPHLGASIEAVRKTEAKLGFEFDDDYVEFLTFANGWDAVNAMDMNLFSLEDLSGSKRFQTALGTMKIQIGELNRIDEINCDFNSDDVFPIAASEYETDIIYMSKRKIKGTPRVFWFWTTFVEAYDSFTEYFLSNREIIINRIQNLNN